MGLKGLLRYLAVGSAWQRQILGGKGLVEGFSRRLVAYKMQMKQYPHIAWLPEASCLLSSKRISSIRFRERDRRTIEGVAKQTSVSAFLGLRVGATKLEGRNSYLAEAVWIFSTPKSSQVMLYRELLHVQLLGRSRVSREAIFVRNKGHSSLVSAQVGSSLTQISKNVGLSLMGAHSCPDS